MGKRVRVEECPWRADQCMGFECWERGPLYRISPDVAANMCAMLLRIADAGLFDSGIRLPISYNCESEKLCPRAWLDSISEQLERVSTRRVDLSVTDDVAYCRLRGVEV